MVQLSVILPTHNPHPARLRRALAGLRDQTVPGARWELIVVDNASTRREGFDQLSTDVGLDFRIVSEPTVGLAAARARGIVEARGEYLVFVDDDNVLAPDYLATIVRVFEAEPSLGAIGGRSVPEFEVEPDAWVRQFDGLIACRDLGPNRLASEPRSPDAPLLYPNFAPIGAGMGLRHDAANEWTRRASARTVPDRRGNELSSGGDNDIILSLLGHGWRVAYVPELVLTHLIPGTRITRDYLGRLNRAVAKSWVQVLRLHDACPWPAIPRWSVPLRQAKAWWTGRAWRSPSAFVTWQGHCGHFEGRADFVANT